MGLIQIASKFLGVNRPNYIFYADINYCATEECADESFLIRAKEIGKEHLFHPFGIRDSGKFDLLTEIPNNSPITIRTSLYLDRIAHILASGTPSENIELPVFYTNFYRKGVLIMSPDNSLSITKKSLADLIDISEAHKSVSTPSN